MATNWNVQHLTDSFQQMGMNDADVPVQFAYHVTNRMVAYNRYGTPINRPRWRQLYCHQSDDLMHDGPLFGGEYVFFSTTLYKNDIPTLSKYPRYGISGAQYWFVKVPLRYFDDFHILYCHEHVTRLGVNQVKLELMDDWDLFEAEQYEDVDERLRRSRPFLTRKLDHVHGGMNYYSNNYSWRKKMWVNFTVSHDFKLPRDVQWDIIKHM